MGLQKKDKTNQGLFVLVLAVSSMVLLVLFFGIVYYVYIKSPEWFRVPEKSKTTSTSTVAETTTTILETTTTTKKPSKLVKSIKNLYADLMGGRECGEDRECFNEASLACKKASFTFDTGRVVQERRVFGKEGDKCSVYYEITEVKDPKVTSTEWLGLNMTCRLNPEDIQKDILSVSSPDCTGPLWDKLKSYAK